MLSWVGRGPSVDEDQARANRYKRPHYRRGDRVRIVRPGVFCGMVGTVSGGPDALQTISGLVLTYLYWLHMDNGARHRWPEEDIAPLAG